MSDPTFDRLRDHSVDGIQEYDNALPGWWLWMFYISIVFGVCYLLWFHYWGGWGLPRHSWEAENERILELQAKAGAIKLQQPEEELRKLSKDPLHIANGKAAFAKFCVVCHHPEAIGLVGPNLRDRWWLHGSNMKDIIGIINLGSPNFQMPKQAGTKLKPDEMIDLACYIVDLNRQGEKTGKPHDPTRDKETPITY